MRTWKTLQPFDADGELELACPKCGTDAMMPTHGHPGCLIIAACGLGLITDPPGRKPPREFMPAEVQCRVCHTIWSEKTDESERIDVRQAV